MRTQSTQKGSDLPTIWDVIVIGAGPAGMMAAGRAGERGKKVLLLEKNETLGKKLLITGGGRCNVTNNKPDVRTMLAKYKESNKFLFSAFSQFSVKDTLAFFAERGMPMKEENDGRMFPVSNSARSVFDVLVAYMKKHGVLVEHKSTVTRIDRDDTTDTFTITCKGKPSLRARACIIATGGTSHPETGSTGDGFAWLSKLNHTVIPNNFALVPIALNDAWVKKLAGVTLPAIKLTLYADAKKQSVHKGKLLFTHVGVSGPTVLNMSSEVGDLLTHSDVTILLDLFPSLDPGALRKKIQTLFADESNKKIKNSLGSIIPSGLVDHILSLVGIDGDTPNHSVSSESRSSLITVLKAIPLHVKGLLGADKAVISAGGVDLAEVDFKTMESRIVPNLYLIGDILNIDRPSGGYSLQLCWTTGYVAGSHV